MNIQESLPPTPVVWEGDLCVIGGSCTGVFAAVRAARLGLRVAIVERFGFFGGVATAAQVNIWHSDQDTEYRKVIWAGLTREVLDRLEKRGGLDVTPNSLDAFRIDTEELKLELDSLVEEQGIRPFLNARFVAPIEKDGHVEAAVIEDKNGRRAIKAKHFIDASGDGDLVSRLAEAPVREDDHLQPPTMCVRLTGIDKAAAKDPEFRIAKTVFDPANPFALPKGFMWAAIVPGMKGSIRMVAGTRVFGCNVADADQLTSAEMEGRRQVRQIVDALRHAGHDEVRIAALPTSIGKRESRHITGLYQLTEEDVLWGRAFDDAIAQGSYRVDIHNSEKPGITFRYLNGVEHYVDPDESRETRWRDPLEGQDDPTCYQIPYRSLVPQGVRNVLAAGRIVDADRGAFGACRVMVTCNQMGEAAGVACALAVKSNDDVADVNTDDLRSTLQEGGSILFQ